MTSEGGRFPEEMNDTAMDPGPLPWWALAGALFALLAVALELLGSAYANSPSPGWAQTAIPLAWAPGFRVVWWLAVAGGVGAYHLGRYRAEGVARPVIAVLSVGAFVGFAVGIAFGAEWATWH